MQCSLHYGVYSYPVGESRSLSSSKLKDGTPSEVAAAPVQLCIWSSAVPH